MTILRAGLYERVSTDEQAKYGYSIRTQIDALNQYCEENNIKIVDHYTDDGVSGGKPALRRPEMSRLLDDVKSNKIDIILFTRLDRWFRNVKEYFKVQEILEDHGVTWKAIWENYDTTTANGRMAITIFLSVHQNEREKGAERVTAVLANKRKNKEACFGGPHKPMGYMKQKDTDGVMRLVKDPEDRQMTEEFWAILIKYNNLNKAVRHMNNVYGIAKSQKTWTRIARNEIYCGMYKGVDDYCEPYVSKEDWLKLQEEADKRIRDTKSKRVYLFTGLIRCPDCGHVLCGTATAKKYKNVKTEYHNYRCRFKLLQDIICYLHSCHNFKGFTHATKFVEFGNNNIIVIPKLFDKFGVFVLFLLDSFKKHFNSVFHRCSFLPTFDRVGGGVGGFRCFL